MPTAHMLLAVKVAMSLIVPVPLPRLGAETGFHVSSHDDGPDEEWVDLLSG